MSPRSPSKRKKARGAKAPFSRKEIEDAFTHIGQRLQTVENLANHRMRVPEQLLAATDLESPRPATGMRTAAAVVLIKPRLEDTINRLGSICSRLEGLDHNIAGGPSSPGNAMVTDTPAPFAIPDQLSVVEELLSRASDLVNRIAERF